MTGYKEFEKKFWNNGNIVYFEWSGGFMGLYIGQTYLNTYVKLFHFTAYGSKKMILKENIPQKMIKLKRLNHKEI